MSVGEPCILCLQMQRSRAGARVRQARVARGWTQASLSHFSGMSSGDISRIENGHLILTDRQLERLAEAFGLPPAELGHRAETLPERRRRD